MFLNKIKDMIIDSIYAFLRIFIIVAVVAMVLGLTIFLPRLYCDWIVWSQNRTIDSDCKHEWFLVEEKSLYSYLYCPVCESYKYELTVEWKKSVINDCYKSMK